MARNHNLAYDYSEFEEEELLYQPKIEHQKTLKRKSRAIPLITSLSLSMVVLALLCSMIYGRVELSRLTTEQSQLSTQLAQIERENASLKSELTAKTGQTTVEDYAENTLKLSKLDKTRVEYVEVPYESVSEVVEPEEKGFFEKLKDRFNSILEYIGIQ